MKPQSEREPTSLEPQPQSRRPGRSFDDPSRPLGAELLDVESPPDDTEFVAKRAKAVAILRKAEEFMRTNNPSPSTPQGMIRALELAAGRMGLKLAEYDAIVKEDPPLQELERQVLEDARRRNGS